MASTTIKTQIVVQFDDQFTERANKANDSYLKSLEDVQQKTNNIRDNFKPFYESSFEEIRKIVNELNALEKILISLSVSAPIVFAIAHTSAFVTSLGVAVLALSGFYGLWLAGENLKEWLIEGEPIEKYADGVKESLDQLANSDSIGLPPIPQETVQSLEFAKNCLQQIQNLRDIFVTVTLVDNATKDAKRIREEIESTFSQDIIQKVKVVQETVQLKIPSFSSNSDSTSSSDSFGGSDSFSGGDSSGGFDGGSVNPGGFNTFSPTVSIPGFAAGIDRVPRDMLAMIHKDEAVLPKRQAEDFRKGGGMNIQNLNFSFNVPNGLKLDREEFRNLAFQMRDELKRLDRRIN